MNNKIFVTAAGIVFLLTSGQAYSQDPGEEGKSEATIRLMQRADAELPEAVTKDIPLPAAEDLPDEAQDGLTTAATKRDAGLSKAEAALQQKADMIQNALDNVENRGRSEEFADPPAGPPEDLPPRNPGN